MDAAAYGTTWSRAQECTYCPRTELASKPIERPYDLRHAGTSFWLYSGMDPAGSARHVGQSVEVLFRGYDRHARTYNLTVDDLHSLSNFPAETRILGRGVGRWTAQS